MKKDLTLLIMAAGMGSRFGGLKQIEPVGPSEEFIIDYTIYDAIQAGFNKVVFIIKEENYGIFKETIGKRIDDKIKVEYAFQDMDTLPGDFKRPETRIKPWGTVHAILAAKDLVKEPFAVVNADDFYGRDAYMKAAEYLNSDRKGIEYAMIGYKTGNTLSENGSVKRGVCKQENNYLVGVVESNVQREDGVIIARPFDTAIEPFAVEDDSLVSMNFFCFFPDLFKTLEVELMRYLGETDLEKCEYLIVELVMEQLTLGNCKVKVCGTDATWYGITYPEDKQEVVKAISSYIEKGDYKGSLWS